MKDKIIAKQDELIDYLVGIAYARGFKFRQPNTISERLTNELAQLKAEKQSDPFDKDEIIRILNNLIPMANDAIKMYEKNGSHQEFIKDDKDEIKEAENLVVELLKAEAEKEVSDKDIHKFLSGVDYYQFDNYYDAIKFGIEAHRDNLIKKG